MSDGATGRKWTNEERAAFQRIAARQAAGDDSDIDYSDAPAMTDEELAAMVTYREWRAKVPVSVRLDPKILEWLKSKGPGHITRIGEILTKVMEAEQRHLASTGIHKKSRS